MIYQDVVIVIPAFEPDQRMLELLRDIRLREDKPKETTLHGPCIYMLSLMRFFGC
ncbi:diguanylate cyclase with PAS/PAC sensor [Streptococcus infantarius subsp. infantarius]|nr:diguanylate cyclase with PAS/PAC sensor [Streptococcus infantarius subsp. infantarius]